MDDNKTPIKSGDILKLFIKNMKYALFTCYVIFVIINMIIKLILFFYYKIILQYTQLTNSMNQYT